MAKSNLATKSSGDGSNDEATTENSELNNSTGNNGTSMLLEGEYLDLMNQAKDWIQENQALAMLGGFGFGVFIGVLLRK